MCVSHEGRIKESDACVLPLVQLVQSHLEVQSALERPKQRDTESRAEQYAHVPPTTKLFPHLKAEPLSDKGINV